MMPNRLSLKMDELSIDWRYGQRHLIFYNEVLHKIGNSSQSAFSFYLF